LIKSIDKILEGEDYTMSFQLSYKPDGYDVLKRLRRLYEQRDQSIILASMEIPSAALNRWPSSIRRDSVTIQLPVSAPSFGTPYFAKS